MFTCKACESKAAHIDDLRLTISNLIKLVHPQSVPQDITVLAQEIDRVLSGSSEPIEYHLSDIQKEESDLLTGAYDKSQVEIE